MAEGVTFRVEKGIPIPPPVKGGRKYPWPRMEVGDSFLVPVPRGKTLTQFQRNMSASARSYSSRNPGKKFVVRKVSAVELRVWRVE